MSGTDLHAAQLTAISPAALALSQVLSLTKDVLHVTLMALVVETDPDVIRVFHF